MAPRAAPALGFYYPDEPAETSGTRLQDAGQFAWLGRDQAE